MGFSVLVGRHQYKMMASKIHKHIMKWTWGSKVSSFSCQTGFIFHKLLSSPTACNCRVQNLVRFRTVGTALSLDARLFEGNRVCVYVCVHADNHRDDNR